MTGLVAGGLSALAYATIGLMSMSEWTTGIGILTIVYLAIAGYASGLATLNSMVHVICNFNRVIAILPIALIISYLKLAPLFDEAIRNIIFPNSPLITYFLVMAAINGVTFIVAPIFVRKIEMT